DVLRRQRACRHRVKCCDDEDVTRRLSVTVLCVHGQQFYSTDAQSAASCQLLSRTEPVSKPSVTTSCGWTQCILTCVGEETEHTKYSWKENNETVKEGNTLTVEKSGEQSKSYTSVLVLYPWRNDSPGNHWVALQQAEDSESFGLQ
ncbi:hypothetical protein Z043_125142, partial [Scleropages formosus]